MFTKLYLDYLVMRVLIIGKNSYIGNHIDEWLTSKGHIVVQLDVLTDEWKVFDYSAFDSIVHVAGIVHRPDCKDWDLYKRVNTDLPLEIAKLAKQQGVKQYVYFSTMGVYDSSKQFVTTFIDENTPLIHNSSSLYAKSKLLAEKGLEKLQDVAFDVAIVRPPSVYGKGCKGGYISGFTKIVKLLPIFPRVFLKGRQSFVYIDNLSECVRIVLENRLRGVFCPQDDKIPNANELFEAIANGLGKKYRDSYLLGLCVRLVSFLPLVKKAYGGIGYAPSLSEINGYEYRVVSFKEGMKRTVEK